MIKPITIAVDFDGTCVTHEFPNVGKDIGAEIVLKELVNKGHKLILYTMRSNCIGNKEGSGEFPHILNGPFLDDAVNWFKKHNIELYAIQRNPEQSWTTSPKCYAQLYIDDAALGIPLIRHKLISERPFVDWVKVRIMLKEMNLL